MDKKISNGVKCALCGYEFDEKNSKSSCKGCFMAGGCDLIRCPNCGYETPREPGWVNPVRNKISKMFIAFPEWFSNGVKKIFKRRSKNGTDRQS